MLANRLIVVIFLIPIAVGILALGGWPYALFITLLLAIGGYEFWRLFHKGGYNPSAWVLIPGIILLTLARYFWGFEYSDAILAGLVLIAMAYHTIMCEKKCQTPATDFTITVAGLLYVGWLGSYLISVRSLPDGLWWVLVAIPAIGIGDGGAYFIGKNFGKHKLAPQVSPQKTVEGYFGGLVFTILGALLMAALWRFRFPQLMLIHGLLLGLILGVLTPMGDLGESMLKRQFHVKDTGTIFSGHGGVLDRLDSWFWGVAISYYVIIWFF
jgi:phosphatidate cytidylyltransferase